MLVEDARWPVPKFHTVRERVKERESQLEKSKGFSFSPNEFQQLNRAQYKNLMTGEHGSPEGRRNWIHIFSSVFPSHSEKDLDSFLDMFAEINVRVSHMKDDSIGIADQNYIYTFIQKSMGFMMDINQAYLKLLSRDCFMYTKKVCFSLDNLKMMKL